MDLVHGPFPALQRELMTLLGRRERFEPALVAAPSARLVRHLKLAAADAFADGLVGVHFVHLFHLAAEMAPPDRPLVRDAIWFERLILTLLRRHFADAPFLGRAQPTYDLAAALLGAIRDLKDAHAPLDPAESVDHLRKLVEERETELNAYDIVKINDVLCLARHYDEALRRLGVMDGSDVWVAAAAAPPPARRIFVYGFYDMTQVQWEFVEALAAGADVTFLSPYEEGPMRFAEPFVKSRLIPAAGAVRAVSAETAAPRRDVFNAAGERDEVWGVAKEILKSRVPFDRIGVVARTMEPYLPHVAAIFAEHAIPWIPPRGRPLADDPKVKFLRGLFRVGLDDFPRGATLDVLRSPFFDGPADRSLWGPITAARRISGGRDLWRRRLEVERVVLRREERERDVPAEAIRALREAFERLRALPIPERGTWSHFTEAYRRAADVPEEVLERLAALPDEIVARAEFQEAFERELDRLEAPAEPRGGVTVTDVMGARGLSFRLLFVLGLNSHAFPRFILEEPFLSDRARRDLFELRGHKISIRHEGYDEERLLFHLMERAATERLVLLTQRSDAEGRKKDPSPFLGGATGEPIPRNLRARLATIEPERMTRQELLLTAADVASCLRAFGRDAARYERACEVLEALEGPALSAHEGIVGPTTPPAEWSASRLETYATCPFQYFARHVLALEPLDDPERAEDLTPAEIGALQHRILELHTRDEVPVAAAAERAFDEFDVPPLDPALREARQALMIRALERFVGQPRGPWVPAEFEVELRGTVAGLPFKGRIDRLDRDGARVRVVDYKGRLSSAWKTHLETLAKNGKKLQAPIYLKLAGAEEAAFLFVEECETRTLAADFWEKHGPAFEQTLKALTGAIAAGRFPVNPGQHCSSCEFRDICRRTYGPTRRKP
jgi:ATP-dependent helicase/nuclease subunit B